MLFVHAKWPTEPPRHRKCQSQIGSNTEPKFPFRAEAATQSSLNGNKLQPPSSRRAEKSQSTAKRYDVHSSRAKRAKQHSDEMQVRRSRRSSWPATHHRATQPAPISTSPRNDTARPTGSRAQRYRSASVISSWAWLGELARNSAVYQDKLEGFIHELVCSMRAQSSSAGRRSQQFSGERPGLSVYQCSPRRAGPVSRRCSIG